MRRHVLSRPGSLDQEARELAQAAARRAGLSLEEWAAALLTGRNGGAGFSPLAPSRPGNDALDGLLARLQDRPRLHPAADREALHEAFMAEAAARSERRIREREIHHPYAPDKPGPDQASRTAIALESMAGWMEQAEERLDETARASADYQDRITAILSQTLTSLKDRLDTVERRVVSEPVSERPAPPARIEFPVQEALEALAPLSETLVGLRQDMARLSERLDLPGALAPAVESIRAEIEGLRSAMEGLATREDVAAIDQAMRDIAADLENGRPNKDLLTLAQSIAALYRGVQTLSDETAESVHRRIGGEIDLLGDRIDRIAETGIDRSVIEALSGQIADMRQDLTRRLAHRAEPEQIARLSEDVAALGRHVADLHANQVGRADFAALKASLENVCSALNRTAAAQEASPVPEQLQRLSERLDILVSRPEPAGLDPIAGQLRALTEQMARFSESRLEQDGALAEMLGRLSSQVQDAAGREPPSPESLVEPLMQRFDRIEEELRQVGQQAETSTVELMLRSIDEKLERAPAPPAVFEAIEKRIAALADRFAHEPGPPQEDAAAIAERAARAVLKDIEPSLPDSGDLDALKQGFVELKALQTRSDKKTQQILNSVQDALQTLVARFPGPAQIAQAMTEPAQARPAPAGEMQPPGDRLEAAVRRLHAAALSQIEEVSAAHAEAAPAAMPGTPDTGQAAEAGLPRGFPPAPPQEADMSLLRASFIAAARRAARAPIPDRPERAASLRPVEGEDAPSGNGEDGWDETSGTPQSLMERIRKTFDSRRRPLLSGLAFLILAAGTVGILLGEDGSPAVASPAVASLPAAEMAQVEERPAAPAAIARVPAVPEGAGLFQASSLTGGAAPAPFGPGRLSADPGTIGPIGTIGMIPAEVPPALRQAALAGDAAALYQVAALVADGLGLAQDAPLAARLYERAAQAGLVPAQERLAMMHEKGLGLPRDLKLAAAWYERAAQGGNIRAMHNLATLLASGIDGKPDYAAAFRWYGEAAEAGLQDSQFNMGVLLARGVGTRQDLAKAYRWFALAASRSDQDAARKRDEIAARLGPAELAAARASVEQWRPRAANPEANEVQPPGRTAALDRTSFNRS